MLKKLLNAILVVAIVFSASVSYASHGERSVKLGETLFSILGDIFESSQIVEISKEIKKQLPDFTLRAGSTLVKDSESVLFKLSLDKELKIEKDGEGFKIETVKYPVETVTTFVSGNIQHSLYEAITSTGEDFSLAMKMADIFEWEIDFFKDIRKGDSFTLLVDKRFIKGEFAGYGKVHAADFFNNGRHIRALYYENGKTRGYFTPEGNSLKKGFLKAPLKFGRVSSTFSHARLHPVLKKVRPHLGVDYAAPVGTPIYATADGYISRRGYDKFNGNYIGLRHTNDYHTMFLHLSKFANGMSIGKYVRQGEVIGYVGNTGISTGPHLDYRLRKGNTYINPLTFKSPAPKLPQAEIAEFIDSTRHYASRLDEILVKSVMVSKFSPTM
jgi:murein DD-endopeptidase MepM/ murein hydrolase activator NlpD